MVDDAFPVGRPQEEVLRTVFVSDATVEAERLAEMLRTSGYFVVDVPLATLLPRAAVQRPRVVLLDADSDGAFDAAAKLHGLAGDADLDVIFLGRERVWSELETSHAAYFARPVDVNALLALLERLTGGPDRPAMRPPTQPPPVLPPVSASIGPPSSYGPPSSLSSAGLMASGLPPASMRVKEPTSSRPPPSRAAASVIPMAAPVSQPAHHASAPPRSAGGFHAPLSAELEALLKEAEERAFAQPAQESTPPSPEDEVEAVLPAEILASLDEPIAEGDDDGGIDGVASRAVRGPVVGAPEQRPFTQRPPTSGAGSSHPAWPGASDSSLSSLQETHAGPGGAPTTGGVAHLTSGVHTEDSEPSREAPPLREPPRPSIPLTAYGTRTLPPERLLTGAPPPMPTSTSTAPPSLRDAPDGLNARPRANGDLLRLVTGAKGPAAAAPDAPLVLGPYDAGRQLAQAIARRSSGSLCFEEKAIVRRVVLLEGDIVTAASSADDEGLVAFLGNRGDLPRETVKRVAGRVPLQGRHAGAALVAHGYLRQDQLWDVLRAHAEWLVGRVLLGDRGTFVFEDDPPGRLKSEPAVLGGVSGCAVFVDVARRVVKVDRVLEAVGGPGARVAEGERRSLLDECGLEPEMRRAVASSPGRSFGDLLEGRDGADLVAVLFALVQLGAIEPIRAVGIAAAAPANGAPAVLDEGSALLEEEAIRERVRARRELVDEGDYFAVLGLSPDATGYEIRRAYLELRKAFEPSRLLTPRALDLLDDVKKILEVLEEAYEILRDGPRRERYRRAITASPQDP